MYKWSELIHLWEREQVTQVQVIGQLLKHGEAQAAQITALQRQVEQVAEAVKPRQGTQPPAAALGKTTTVRR
jgi:hypothetical protein